VAHAIETDAARDYEPELAFTLDETIEWFKSNGLDETTSRSAWIRPNGRSGALAVS